MGKKSKGLSKEQISERQRAAGLKRVAEGIGPYSKTSPSSQLGCARAAAANRNKKLKASIYPAKPSSGLSTDALNPDNKARHKRRT